MRTEVNGFCLPTPAVADVAVVSSEEEEVVSKVETNPDGEADPDLSRSHRQKRVDGADMRSMPRKTVQLPTRSATSVARSDTSDEHVDREMKSRKKTTREQEADPDL